MYKPCSKNRANCQECRKKICFYPSETSKKCVPFYNGKCIAACKVKCEFAQ